MYIYIYIYIYVYIYVDIVMWCYVVLCCAMWCYVVLSGVMWCYIVLCCVMLCYVVKSGARPRAKEPHATKQHRVFNPDLGAHVIWYKHYIVSYHIMLCYIVLMIIASHPAHDFPHTILTSSSCRLG